MIRITLVCAGGMSTSLLVGKMKAAAVAQGVEVEIRAMAEVSFEAEGASSTDILLVGPQIAYKFKALEALCTTKGIKAALINPADYGMMNGAKVLAQALALR